MQNKVPLLRVLLVDDEPFIRKGLAALIDWEAEGYCIAGEASNGKNAIQLLREQDYDLIITDIKMPEMDGTEFINHVKQNNLSNASFVFLSGYYDFQYAKTAIQCGCFDYILKPIQKEDLLSTLRKIMSEYQKEADIKKDKEDYEKAYLERHLTAIVWGKNDSINLKYVKERMRFSDEIAYLHCEVSLNDDKFLALTEDGRREIQRKLYNYASLLLKNYSDHIIFDVMKHTLCYDVGIIYCTDMAAEKELSGEEWLQTLVHELTERVGYEIIAHMGSVVNDIGTISKSFREAVMLRSLRSYKKNSKLPKPFRYETTPKNQKDDNYKRQLDDLIHVIEINDKQKIRSDAKAFYRSMTGKDINPELVTWNIHYFLYRLLGLAYVQEADINQEEIMQYIRENVFSSMTNYASELKFQQFAEEYSDYLAQLRMNTAKGTLTLIEAEIEGNYAENISLKSLGEKYFINSAYLGQIFKKQYGCAFKDYLNNIRIRKAAELILGTDKTISVVAGEVGYKNMEYFVSKFEETYGMTPTRFRKRNTNSETFR